MDAVQDIDDMRRMIDAHVGANITRRRKEAGISRSSLSACLGLPADMLERYEAGMVRVPPSHLIRISRRLGRPAETFVLDGLSELLALASADTLGLKH